MDLLGLIKDKLTDTVVEKISGFLGEHPEKINAALSSAVPTVMGGIVQKANTPEEVGKLLDILKDGGHTGDILDDISGILGHFDKTQMLITIGTNIANHFFGEKTNNIIETLSSVSAIRKTSSSSLLGLATPLVLGAFGKVVAKEGLGVSGLMKLLDEQKDGIQKALPPALFNQLDTKALVSPSFTNSEVITETKVEAHTPPVLPTKVAPKKDIATQKSSSSSWLPWILLLLLGLGALAWVKGYKNIFKHNKESDSLKVNAPIVADTHEDSTKNSHQQENNAQTDSKSTVSEPVKEKREAHKVQPKIENTVPKPTKVERKAVRNKVQTDASDNSSVQVSGGSLTEKLDNDSGNWIGLNHVSFKHKSAEITGKGQIEELAKYLRNHSKAKVKIVGFRNGDKVLAEDRAYAVREALLEKGISEGRVQVSEESLSNKNYQVGVKISK